ncbi:hypothetical protein AB6A23_12705 [Paenibacillus tarimensis]
MTFAGIIIGAGLLIILFMVMGPAGAGLFMAIIFGLVFSNHFRNKEMYEDIKKIKAHLGLMENEELEDYKSEEELRNAMALKDDPDKLKEVNQEIEKELEQYVSDDQEKNEK